MSKVRKPSHASLRMIVSVLVPMGNNDVLSTAVRNNPIIFLSAPMLATSSTVNLFMTYKSIVKIPGRFPVPCWSVHERAIFL